MKLYRKINVLGTKYSIYRVRFGEDEYMEKMHFGGMCTTVDHRIYILDLATVPDWKDEPEQIRQSTEHCTLRHEVIHAFLNESGLQWDSFAPEKAWAKNEEMVDWLAIQLPKIFKIYQELGCLD